MDRIITMEDVYWQRSGVEILKDINWTVNRGEHWAILGLNGSGKTSVLNIVTGYNYPTRGKVKVLDTEFGKASIPELRKRIGYVSSSLGRFAQTMDRETAMNIIISGKHASFGLYREITAADRDRAEKILKDLRLLYLKDKTYNLLSQGEQRRVLIGRALMASPDLLILDEPCSGLDVLAREDVLYIAEHVAEKSSHLLYVTHHIEEISNAVTHVLLVRDGEITAGGPKREVLTDILLSKAYKIPVKVHWENGRPWMSINK